MDEAEHNSRKEHCSEADTEWPTGPQHTNLQATQVSNLLCYKYHKQETCPGQAKLEGHGCLAVSACDRVTCLTQVFGQVFLHLRRSFVRHRVQMLKQLWQQSDAMTFHY
jgi:hypothetical protein